MTDTVISLGIVYFQFISCGLHCLPTIWKKHATRGTICPSINPSPWLKIMWGILIFYLNSMKDIIDAVCLIYVTKCGWFYICFSHLCTSWYISIYNVHNFTRFGTFTSQLMTRWSYVYPVVYYSDVMIDNFPLLLNIRPRSAVIIFFFHIQTTPWKTSVC